MRDLSRLLRPKSVAVIGGGWGRNVITQLDKAGFGGQLWPVHPKAQTIGGHRAYPTVEDLPAPPDAAFVAVNRAATLETIAALSTMGAGGAICFASGFAEAEAEASDGRALQAQLLAQAGDMPILGPNCYGLLNYVDAVALWPDQHGGGPVARGVALLAQSSNILLNLTMQTRGLPVAFAIALGNQAQTSMAAVGRVLLSDPRVTAIGLYVEGFGDLRDWEAFAAEAAAAGKPIVALKSGKSEQAQAAAVSHTASVAGSHAGAAALMRRLGIAEVSSLSTLIETLKILHAEGWLETPRIASMSCSGGEASVMADSAVGVTYPALNRAQTSALRAALGPMVALANPLDYHTYIWGDVDAMAATYEAMLQGDVSLGVLVLDFPRPDRCSAEEWESAIEALGRARQRSGKRVAILSSLSENLQENIAYRLLDRGIIPLCGVTEGLAAITAAVRPSGIDRAPVLLPGPAKNAQLHTEAAAKAILARFGLSVPRSVRVNRPAEAGAASAALSWPVVLKGEGLAHKSDTGAVVLDLNSPEAVVSAAEGIAAPAYLIEEMVTGAVAEILVGVTKDPAHGFVLTIGAGGVLTELIEDSVSFLLPVQRSDLRRGILSTKAGTLLCGYRGKPAANMDALLDEVEKLQEFVTAYADQLEEVEINPMMCTPSKAWVADALLRKA